MIPLIIQQLCSLNPLVFNLDKAGYRNEYCSLTIGDTVCVLTAIDVHARVCVCLVMQY